MKGPIRIFERDRVVDRHEHRLRTAWVRSASVVCPELAAEWLLEVDEGSPRPPIGGDSHDPVLVMSGSTSGPVHAELLEHARRGARLYVVASSDWAPVESVLQHCATMFVRRVLDVPVSAILRGPRARLWLGSSHEGPLRWELRLDEEQAVALRQLFLRSFWHDAIDEAWGGDVSPVFRDAGARPFDVPAIPPGAPLQWLEGPASLGLLGPEHRVHQLDSAPSNAAVKSLYLPPGGAHHPEIASLVRGGARVGWDDHGLPELATDGKGGVLLLPSEFGQVRLVLNQGQAAECAERLDRPSAWRFVVDARLGDHASGQTALWIAQAEDARSVQPEQELELPDVPAATLRAMAEASPATWPDPHPLALTVRYRWRVRPPWVPKKAREDALVGRWRALDERWRSRLDALDAGLAAVDEHRSRLVGISSRLQGAVLGFERTAKELRSEHSAMAGRLPSRAGPQGAHDLLHRLTALESGVHRLCGVQEDAEHEARVADERERQRADWEAKVAEARRERPRTQSALHQSQERETLLDEQLAEVERGLRASGLAKRERKDLTARRHKLEDERERLKQRGRQLQADLTGLEHRIDEPFAFVEPARAGAATKGAGARFVPTAPKTSQSEVPDEGLPEVGHLRRLKGRRYLVIDTWDELERGEAEADRLGAKLCISEGA